MSAPTWPPDITNSAYSSGLVSQGYTTIKWGTDGSLLNTAINNSNGGYNGIFIVESIRGADEIENIYIEQGNGLKTTRIQLIQGRKYTITVIDDKGLVPPEGGTIISVMNLMGQSGANAATAANFRVIENGYNAARKVEGKREIVAEYLTLIEGGGTALS